MEQSYSGRKADKETVVFAVFFIFMAFYYGRRMFALTPWYDELYTYYYFISRGPFYAAIHWPLPNNHIGYSVLSACLGIFGNSAVALRGVSWAASLGSLVLVFRIGRKCFGRGMALMPVFLYAGMKLVNQLAVQGRGYALVSFCYLAAVCALLHITAVQERIRDYFFFGVSLTLALYAIPSSVYVALPVCLTGGIILLMQGERGKLGRLILTSVASAVCTVGLYGIVWLAIGSNLLVKTEGNAYYGMGHASVILHAPVTALGAGIEYMLATPYIQSVDRSGFAARFVTWIRSLLNEYYVGGDVILAVLLILCIVGTVVWIGLRGKREKGKAKVFMPVYLLVSITGIPFMLILQSSLPYYRVFSFAGVVVAFAATWLFGTLTEYLRERQSGRFSTVWKYLPWTVIAMCGILCVALLFSSSYRAQYSGREAAIEDAYARADWGRIEKTAVTDCDQEYLLLFLYDIGEQGIAERPEEADMVLADKYLLLGQESGGSVDYDGDVWKMYTTQEEFVRFVEAAGLKPVYENDRFVLFE